MSGVATYKCDGAGCGKVKEEMSDWWCAFITQLQGVVDGQTIRMAGDVFSVTRFRPEFNCSHYCSQECVSKAFQKFLDK